MLENSTNLCGSMKAANGIGQAADSEMKTDGEKIQKENPCYGGGVTKRAGQ